MFSPNDDFRMYDERREQMLREAEHQRLVQLARTAQEHPTVSRLAALRRANLRLVGRGLWRWPAREDLAPLPKAGWNP